MTSLTHATVISDAPVRNRTVAITVQSIRQILIEVSWHQLESVVVPVPDMGALFHMPWLISKRESSTSAAPQ